MQLHDNFEAKKFQYRDILFDNNKLLSGVSKLSDAVSSTLGPKGQVVLIEGDMGLPYITKDGVTVAKSVIFEDPQERMAAFIVTQAATSTLRQSGDGTTTSIVLANDIIKRASEIEGVSSVDVTKGIQEASAVVLKELDKDAKKLDNSTINHIATISSNNDKKLGKIIADTFIEAGDDGIVDCQVDINAMEVTGSVKPGSFVPLGYASQYLINNKAKRTVELDNPLVLVSNASIQNISQIEKVFEYVVEKDRALLIIAQTERDFDEALVANVSRGNIKANILKPDANVDSEMLKDLADLVGATYFDERSGNDYDHIDHSYLGEATKSISDDFATFFIIEKPNDVTSNIALLTGLVDKETNALKKKKYKLRLSMLNGKSGNINIGAPTDVERNEIKDRVEDAVLAVQSAKLTGYLPGGGVALRDISKSIKRMEGVDGFSLGFNLMLDAIVSPFNKILDNAGIEAPKSSKKGSGINAVNGQHTNMEKSGIIDPLFVTKQAVTNAVSAITTLLQVKASIIKTTEYEA